MTWRLLSVSTRSCDAGVGGEIWQLVLSWGHNPTPLCIPGSVSLMLCLFGMESSFPCPTGEL